MTRIDNQLERASEDIDLFLVALPDVLRRLRDGMAGQPAAQRYDTPRVGGHTTVLDELGTSMPSVSDPTGEAAVNAAMGGDRASTVHRRILKLTSSIARHANELVAIAASVQRRGPTEKERKETDKANANEPGCRSCARTEVAKGVKRWEPRYGKSTLCRWCRSWAGIHGATDAQDPNDPPASTWPPLDVLERHLAGDRIRVKA